MASTLNVFLPKDDAAWVRSRKEEKGFASTSDVIRDLIRREREKELEAQFDRMDRRDGSNGPVPVGKIVNKVKNIRKELLKRHEAGRRP